jgi:phage terminase large subunit GpA-like protein
LWTVAAATFKSETYRFLRLSPPIEDQAYPAGYVHLPRGIDAEWVKQLVAEQLVTVKTRRGFTRLEWQKMRERNEALDCRVYARAAAWIAGIDRWPERKWRELEKQLGIESPPRAIVPVAGHASLDQHLPAAPASEKRGVAAARPAGWLGGRSPGWLRRR